MTSILDVSEDVVTYCEGYLTLYDDFIWSRDCPTQLDIDIFSVFIHSSMSVCPCRVPRKFSVKEFFDLKLSTSLMSTLCQRRASPFVIVALKILDWLDISFYPR